MSCPADIVIKDATGNKLRVIWNHPVATDNSGNTPKVTSNKQPGFEFPVPSSYEVIYQATDKSTYSNSSYCSFRINIECKYFRNWGKTGERTGVGEVGGGGDRVARCGARKVGLLM